VKTQKINFPKIAFLLKLQRSAILADTMSLSITEILIIAHAINSLKIALIKK
jgi:hypothetical protein